MPELPEVETSCRGIRPILLQQTITGIVIRQPRLRWPIPQELTHRLPGQRILAVQRRAKYILITTTQGTLLLHLGMSGSVRIVVPSTPLLKHDHVDIVLATHQCLRYHDPRRFGALLWTEDDITQHILLRDLGPEPLSAQFNAAYLQQKAQTKKIPIKSWLMNSRIVVGIGNIYANEALFLAKIHPLLPIGQLALDQWTQLVTAIQHVLQQAINQGGTTLRDFVASDGKPGYFKQQLTVYGREGHPCRRCATILIPLRIQQRSSVFCPRCQPLS